VAVFGVIRDERLGLVERLRGLPAEAWATPSLCAGWSVHHVVAHLVTPFSVTPAQLAVEVVRGRGIGGAMDRIARRLQSRPTDDLLAMLEANAGSTFRPPGMPAAAPLTDIVAHGADIRWALGDGHGDWGQPARLAPVLDFLVSPRAHAGFVPVNRLKGLRLVAADQDWAHGTGREVRGPSLALAMAVLGRPAALPSVQGDGVEALRA
jgi:uncharacterized protein (TIGR03083 family)